MTRREAVMIAARIEEIIRVLGLPRSELGKAVKSEDGLLAFARRHGQSLDWIVDGDARVMIGSMALYKHPSAAKRKRKPA